MIKVKTHYGHAYFWPETVAYVQPLGHGQHGVLIGFTAGGMICVPCQHLTDQETTMEQLASEISAGKRKDAGVVE